MVVNFVLRWVLYSSIPVYLYVSQYGRSFICARGFAFLTIAKRELHRYGRVLSKPSQLSFYRVSICISNELYWDEDTTTTPSIKGAFGFVVNFAPRLERRGRTSQKIIMCILSFEPDLPVAILKKMSSNNFRRRFETAFLPLRLRLGRVASWKDNEGSRFVFVIRRDIIGTFVLRTLP